MVVGFANKIAELVEVVWFARQREAIGLTLHAVNARAFQQSLQEPPHAGNSHLRYACKLSGRSTQGDAAARCDDRFPRRASWRA